MGKSGKKTKSDRINALRKQYDAFLDEDKKRKDRNEFILGRLEKIRSSTPVVVPVRHIMGNPQINKYNFIPQERPEYVRKIRFDNSSILRSRQYDDSPYCITKDEEIMLQEISKKYILIPRLRSINENSVTFYKPPNENNDTDWRNKYNILDELKKAEKEDLTGVSKENIDSIYDNIGIHGESNITESNIGKGMISNTNKVSIHNPQRNEEKLQPTLLQTNSAETVPLIDTISDSNKQLERNKNNVTNSVKNTGFENEVLHMPVKSATQEEYTSDSNKTNNEYYVENVIQAEQSNENMNDEKLAYCQIQDVQLNENKEIHDDVSTKYDAHFVSKNRENVIEVNEPVQQTNPIEFSASEVVDSNVTAHFNETENINFHPKEDEVESQENQEQYHNVGQTDTTSEHIPQQEYESPNEATVVSGTVISSQINDFETEQKEMFYSEETGYAQNVDNMGSGAQNEGYTNEEYSYYNESQQDQPYYPEVNEHVESTEQYDPSYEQQYVGNYDENVNAQYENQQYSVDNYENQPEVTNVNYEQHPDQQETIQGQPDLSTENYEQPVNYEYEQSGYLDDQQQSHIENTNIYDTQAGEHVDYDNQQYNEMGQIEHLINPDQSTYEGQQDYVQNTEHETIQNLEEQLDLEEGYIETAPLQSEPVTEVGSVKEIESNIKAT